MIITAVTKLINVWRNGNGRFAIIVLHYARHHRDLDYSLGQTLIRRMLIFFLADALNAFQECLIELSLVAI